MQLDVDVQVFAQITGFSGDAATPLVLDNGAKISLKKRVCKMNAVDRSVNLLGYDPHSGHYQALCDFIIHTADSAPAEAADLMAPEGVRAAPHAVPAARKPATPDNGGTSAGKCAPSAAQPASALKKVRAQAAVQAEAAAEVTSVTSSAADAATAATTGSRAFDWLSEAPLLPVRAKALSFGEGADTKEEGGGARGFRSATKRKAGVEGQANVPDEGEAGSARKSPRRTSSEGSSNGSSGGAGMGEAARTPSGGKRGGPAAALTTPADKTTAEAGSAVRGKSARKATPPAATPAARGSSSSEKGRNVHRRSATHP
jgi:hypothetical protein